MFDWGAFIISFLTVSATVISVIALLLKGRGENKNAAGQTKIALDARIDARVAEQLKEAWTEIEGLKTDRDEDKARQVRRDLAMTRVLRAIAKQWPAPEGPDLDPADIAEIQETVPMSWIRKSRSDTGPTLTK